VHTESACKTPISEGKNQSSLERLRRERTAKRSDAREALFLAVFHKTFPNAVEVTDAVR